MDLAPYRAFMTELASGSGDIIRPHFANPELVVEAKADHSPVTAADRGAEAWMRREIGSRFPSHGILGEEFGADRLDAEFVWVLDPIDGTESFAAAVPLFGTLIALMHQGRPILGCIHQPILGQLMIGDGRVTTLNGRTVRARPVRQIEDATLLTSDPLNPGRHKNGAAFEALSRRARMVRTWGDCYGYFLVASGWAHIMTDPIMNPWDIAALVPIISGAGAIITDWHGNDPVGAASIVAAAGAELHEATIRALNP